MRIKSLCLAALIFVGCSAEQPTSVSTSTPTPEQTVAATPSTKLSKEQAIAKATSTFKEFGGELKGKLQAAMKEGGPVNAVKVCHEVAPQMAKQTSERVGFQMGRSSHRLRNQDNAPIEAVAEYLKRHAESGGEAPVEAVQEGEQWVVIAPIATQPLCLTCHGDPKTFSPELVAALEKNYPSDQATGFEAGDLRGVFWAKLP